MESARSGARTPGAFATADSDGRTDAGFELPDPASLATTQLDDVFSNLVRGPDNRAEFWVEAGGEEISVIYGPKYTVAVIYAPPGKDFVCFEPMSAITDAFNLAHAGSLQRTTEHSARRHVAREFLDSAERVLARLFGGAHLGKALAQGFG